MFFRSEYFLVLILRCRNPFLLSVVYSVKEESKFTFSPHIDIQLLQNYFEKKKNIFPSSKAFLSIIWPIVLESISGLYFFFPFIYIFISSPILHSLDYCILIVNHKKSEHLNSPIFPSFKNLLWLFLFICISIKILDSVFQLLQNHAGILIAISLKLQTWRKCFLTIHT